jgi:hypothetical protein
MLASGTLSIPTGSTPVDVLQQLGSISGAPWLPAHFIKLQNNGSGTIRVAEIGSVQGGIGIKVGPGEQFEIQVAAGDRIGLVGNAGAAASGIDVILGTV